MAEWEFLAGVPDVPGLAFRPFRGPSDYPVMAGILNAACAADGVDRVERVEDVASNYEHLDNCDPFADMVFAEVGGTPVGYGRVAWWQETQGPRRYMPFCFLRPEGRGRGIGGAMLAHNEERIRRIAAGHPAGLERTLDVYFTDTEAGARALYEAAGYSAVHYDADMVRPDLTDLPAAPMPEGLVVRTPTEDEMPKVWEADQEAFRDHVGYAEPTENDYARFLEFPWRDPSLWRVAWDGDEIAGQVRSFIDPHQNERFGRRRGWTEFISVRRPYRRRGLARSLLVQSLQAVRDAGMDEAALGVHTANPHGAFDLYESVGFRVVRLWTTCRKPLDPDT